MPTGTDTALARISAAAYDDGTASLPAGFARLADLGLPGFSNGVYRNGNAAALVVTGKINGSPTVVLAFRGSDDREDSINDLRNINTDYPKFAGLIAAVDAYAAREGYGQVAVTGHSLGGAMTQLFMASRADTTTVRYVSDTFGSPGALLPDGPDGRLTNYRIADDPAVFLGENRQAIGAELRANPLYASAAVLFGPDAFPSLTSGDVIGSLCDLTTDYENRGTDFVLPRADGTTFLLQNIEQVANADPQEHKVATYIARVQAASGSAGDDQGAGGAGNDRITGTFGNDTLDGGAGYDYLDLSAIYGYRGASLTPGNISNPPGGGVLSHDGQVDTYLNIEEIRFLDGRLALDPNDAAARVVRLYQAAFARGADQAGLNFWQDQLNAGASLETVASSFVGSAEFAARFGALDNGGYVDQLYQNVLGRAPDAGGRAFWVGALDAGATRAAVLGSFSESTENRANTALLTAGGVWDRDETAAVVARLYDTAFDRAPDRAGLLNWKSNLQAGTISLERVATEFSASAEFSAKYGSLGTRDYVSQLYLNTLDRAGDAGGLDYWSGAIDAGVNSRPVVLLAFSESAEHQRLTAPSVGGDTPDTYGIRFA